MGRRLPWTHPHLKVDYGAGTNGSSSGHGNYSSSSSKMVSRTPRGKRLIYNGGGSNSRRSGGYGGAGSPPSSQKKRLDGLYFEGAWWCNCTPRVRAPMLQVKKKGPNTGKWFYTCDTRKCGFFLWAEDAKNRAEGVTMTVPPMPDEVAAAATPGASTAPAAGGPAATPAAAAAAPALPTPATTQTTAPRRKFMENYFSTQSKPSGADTNDKLVDQGSRVRQVQQQQAETPSRSTKRKRVLFEFSDDDEDDKQEDDYGLGDMSSDEERAMNEAMERSASKLRAAAPSTPLSRRTVADDAHPTTPSTVTRTLFPDAKRRRGFEPAPPSPRAASFGSDINNTSFSTNNNSASSSMTAAAASPPQPPASTPSKEEEHVDPTDDVLALLRRPGQKVDEATARDVEAVLRRFAMKARGIARGRDSVRAAVRAKDERIAALQERVASLEGRNRAQREQIADFKASIMDLYSKH